MGERNVFCSNEAMLDGVLEEGLVTRKTNYDKELGSFSPIPYPPEGKSGGKNWLNDPSHLWDEASIKSPVVCGSENFQVAEDMKELEAVYTTSRHLAPCLFAIWMLICISTSYCFITQSCLNSLWPYGLKPARFLCPWDFPGKNIGVGCHFLLQRIFSTQGSNPYLLPWQTVSLLLSHQGNPHLIILFYNIVVKGRKCFPEFFKSFWQVVELKE